MSEHKATAEPGWLRQAWNDLAAQQRQTMAQDTSARAWLLQGLEELRSVATPTATEVQAATPPGAFGTMTSGEVTAERRDPEPEM